MNNEINKTLENFLQKNVSTKKINDNTEEICDLQTGECYVIKSKDGLVERINKTYVVEDGRQLILD